MPLRPCLHPGCPALVPRGRCPAHQQPTTTSTPDPDRPSDHHLFKPFYNSALWLSTRRLYLSLHPICAICTSALSTDVHHNPDLAQILTSLGYSPTTPKTSWPREFWRRACDPANLQALCKGCHSRVTVERDGGFGNPRAGETRRGERG